MRQRTPPIMTLNGGQRRKEGNTLRRFPIRPAPAGDGARPDRRDGAFEVVHRDSRACQIHISSWRAVSSSSTMLGCPGRDHRLVEPGREGLVLIASFLKLRKPPPGARSSTCRSQTRTSRFPCWKPGSSLCRNRMLGGPIQPRFTSHAVTSADAALIASLTSWRVAVG